MNSNTQSYNLLISHNQIQVRTKEFDEELCSWGRGNLEQGVIIHDSYVVFDPLPEDTFGAYINVSFKSKFELNKETQRCIVVPFIIEQDSILSVASAGEKFNVDLVYTPGKYNLYYEVCEGDEVYYQLTFIATSVEINPKYIIDDPWGGVRGRELCIGKI